MDDDGHAHRLAEVNAIKRSQSHAAEIMKSSHHPWRWNGGADHQQKVIREKEEISYRNFIGIEENPVIKYDTKPDDKGEEDVDEQISDGMKKFQAADEFNKKFVNSLGKFLREWFQEKGSGGESPFPEKIDSQGENDENRREDDSDRTPKLKV